MRAPTADSIRAGADSPTVSIVVPTFARAAQLEQHFDYGCGILAYRLLRRQQVP